MRPLRRAAAGILPWPRPGSDLRCLAHSGPNPQRGESSMTDAAPGSAGPRMHTEEEIQSYSVEPIEPLTGPIVLAEADPEWPAVFAREEERIRSILGDR